MTSEFVCKECGFTWEEIGNQPTKSRHKCRNGKIIILGAGSSKRLYNIKENKDE